MDAGTFLDVADAAQRLIASPGVDQRWDDPSALEGYSVGGLAGHLARAVLTVERYLDAGPPDPQGAITDAAGYLVRVLGSHDPVESEFHGRVRERGAEEAAHGQGALLDRLRTVRETLAQRLPEISPDRPIEVLDGVVIPLDEYLETRLVELIVHLDDLAVSVGHDGPEGVPDEAYEIVTRVLATVAARRVGALPTIRSLARRERHPDAVRAL